MGARPLIAVLGMLVEGGGPKVELRLSYAEALERAGALPVLVPYVGDAATRDALLGRVDGLLLSGGDDFDTERLGLGPTHPAARPVAPAKQDFDAALARAALARGLPALGVCYGMQLLALVEGARFLQNLPDDRPGGQEHRDGAVHGVAVEPGTKLAALLGVGTLPVVSRHHQAIASVGPPWRVSARDAEGLIEAIERAGHPFALGVQWHPELDRSGGAGDRLFAGLVEAARARASQRAPLGVS